VSDDKADQPVKYLTWHTS